MTGIIEQLNENISKLNQNIEALIVALGSAGVGQVTASVSNQTASTTMASDTDDGAHATGGDVPWDVGKGKDKRDMYHDPRVHSKNGAKNADGTWRVAKGLENREEQLAKVKAEQDAYYASQGDDEPEADASADETPAAGSGMFETETRQLEKQDTGDSGDGCQVDFDGLFKECKSYMIEVMQLYKDNARTHEELHKIFEKVGIQQINQANEGNVSKLQYELSQLVQKARAEQGGQGDDPDAALQAMMG